MSAATPLTIVQLRCPSCKREMWVMDHIVRGLGVLGGREKPFTARRYKCTNCRYRGSGFGFLQKAPSGFLLQPHPHYPMGRKAFRYWIDILQEHFPDYYRLKSIGTRFYPAIPNLHHQLAGALTIMSFMLDTRNGPRRYGNQAFKMDRVCLSVLFEHHVRRLFNIPPAHTERRLVEHIDGIDTEILTSFTLRRLALAVFGEAAKVVEQRPTYEHWRKDPYFAVGLDAFHRFAHQPAYPDALPVNEWRYMVTRELPAGERVHTRLWLPVEDVL